MIKRISYEQCLKVTEFLFKKPAEYEKGPITIGITDQAGKAIYIGLYDGMHTRTGEMAINKAFTATRMEKRTEWLRDVCKNKGYDVGVFNCPGLTPIPGGTPIVDATGEIIGGIGISGWTSEEDQMLSDACAEFLANEFKK